MPTTFTFGNTSIKQKRNNIFSHVIKFTNKTSQELVKVMEKMFLLILNLNITMCHAFIKDQVDKSPLMDILNFSYDLEDEVPICSLHIFSDEEQK